MEGHVGNRQTCREFVELRCVDTVVDFRENELGQPRVIHRETRSRLPNALQHLVETHRLRGAISLNNVHDVGHTVHRAGELFKRLPLSLFIGYSL